MARVMLCDRCGVLGPGDASYTVTMNSPYPWEHNTNCHDLCIKCAADFREFMENKHTIPRINLKTKEE